MALDLCWCSFSLQDVEFPVSISYHFSGAISLVSLLSVTFIAFSLIIYF